MPNGKPGDHPYTDVVDHGIDVYSPEVDQLIREISKLSNRAECDALAYLLITEYNDRANPDIAKLKRYLQDLRGRLVQRARDGGWETP